MKKYLKYGLLLFILVGIQSCADQIVSECTPEQIGNTSAVRARFSDIQGKVFTPSCALSGCHNGSVRPNLTSGKAYIALYNVDSQQNANQKLVKPGNSNRSYLITKLTGRSGIVNSIMPLGGNKLPSAVIDSIAVWIDKGALDN